MGIVATRFLHFRCSRIGLVANVKRVHIGGKAVINSPSRGLHRVPREVGIAGGRVDPPSNPIVQTRRSRFITVFIHSLELA